MKNLRLKTENPAEVPPFSTRANFMASRIAVFSILCLTRKLHIATAKTFPVFKNISNC